MTWISAIEARKQLPVAVRGFGSSLALSESVDLCFAFFVFSGIKHTDIHGVQVSGSRGQSGDSEESG